MDLPPLQPLPPQFPYSFFQLVLEPTTVGSQNHLYLVLLPAVGICQWWCMKWYAEVAVAICRDFCQNLQMLCKSPFQSLKTEIN